MLNYLLAFLKDSHNNVVCVEVKNKCTVEHKGAHADWF